MYTNNHYYVALISKTQGQCGLKASLQPLVNLSIQIQVLDKLSIKLQEPSYHSAVHAISNLRVASQ